MSASKSQHTQTGRHLIPFSFPTSIASALHRQCRYYTPQHTTNAANGGESTPIATPLALGELHRTLVSQHTSKETSSSMSTAGVYGSPSPWLAGSRLMTAASRPIASRYWNMPKQYVVLPEPGGPTTICPKRTMGVQSEMHTLQRAEHCRRQNQNQNQSQMGVCTQPAEAYRSVLLTASKNRIQPTYQLFQVSYALRLPLNELQPGDCSSTCTIAGSPRIADYLIQCSRSKTCGRQAQ